MAIFGLFKPQRHGSINTAAILLYALTSCIAGYISSSYYRKFQGTKWVANIILTASLYTGKQGITNRCQTTGAYLMFTLTIEIVIR